MTTPNTLEKLEAWLKDAEAKQAVRTDVACLAFGPNEESHKAIGKQEALAEVIDKLRSLLTEEAQGREVAEYATREATIKVFCDCTSHGIMIDNNDWKCPECGTEYRVTFHVYRRAKGGDTP